MSMLLRRRRIDIQGAPKEVAPSSVKEKSAPKAKEKAPAITEEVINAMNGTKLRKLAKENGIDNPEDLTAGELKAVLCGMLVG